MMWKALVLMAMVGGAFWGVRRWMSQRNSKQNQLLDLVGPLLQSAADVSWDSSKSRFRLSGSYRHHPLTIEGVFEPGDELVMDLRKISIPLQRSTPRPSQVSRGEREYAISRDKVTLKAPTLFYKQPELQEVLRKELERLVRFVERIDGVEEEWMSTDSLQKAMSSSPSWDAMGAHVGSPSSERLESPAPKKSRRHAAKDRPSRSASKLRTNQRMRIQERLKRLG